MKALLKKSLDRAGLAPAAFRTRERLRAIRLRRRPTAPDGYPLPPGHLMVLVTGSADANWYVEGGKLAAASILDTLREAGLDPRGLRSILDFGCGCGRVIRHWPALTGAELHGSDYNPMLVDWCRLNLPLAQFQQNTLQPRLDYPEHRFEFAYALSVFTHTPEELEQAWMDELWRVLEPGGYLLITTQGDEFVPNLTRSERALYADGRAVVRYRHSAGTNLCSVYHPEQYVRENLARRFSVAAFRPRAAAGNGHQDVYLLRKES